jgi:D-arabinose 1-dehydrogenase-like Zn-dependent alcohol dehydrogenase
VVAGFIVGRGTCELCQRALPNACARRKLYGVHFDGGYAEYARVSAQIGRLAQDPGFFRGISPPALACNPNPI